MQPARKLLSLLFLLLMGTELTQVRAPNAIFLPPGAREPAKSGGSWGSPAAKEDARVPAATLGMEGGVQTERLGPAPHNPQLGPSWAAVGDPLPAEKFEGRQEGALGCGHGGGRAGCPSPPLAGAELS